MTLKQIQKHGDTFFLTIKSIDGLPILLNRTYYQIILDSLKFCRENKGWEIYAYTILINHLHLVLKISEKFSLSNTIRDFKQFTSKRILNKLKKDNQFDLLKELEIVANKDEDRENKVWRRSCWPEVVSTEKFLLQKVKYIDLNAQKHGIVDDIEKYPYTSYHNHYCEHKAVLEIDDFKELL